MTTDLINKKWNGRGSIVELAAELERQLDSIVDFVCDMRNLAVRIVQIKNEEGEVVRSDVYLGPAPQADATIGEFLDSDTGHLISDHALGQLAYRLKPEIPVRFLRNLIHMRPDRAEWILNGLLQDTGDSILIRMMDNEVRAILSSKYRCIDNFTIAKYAVEASKKHKAVITECRMTRDGDMNIRMISHELAEELDMLTERGERHGWVKGAKANKILAARTNQPVGEGEKETGPEIVYPCVDIGNSEVGRGTANVWHGIVEAACNNSYIMLAAIAERHLGGRLDEGIYTAETQRANAKTIMLKLRDNIDAAFNADNFKKLVAQFRSATEVEVTPTRGVNMMIDEKVIPENLRDDLLKYMVRDYDETALGLAQAVSRLSQDVDNPTTATEMERAAAKILANAEAYAEPVAAA